MCRCGVVAELQQDVVGGEHSVLVYSHCCVLVLPVLYQSVGTTMFMPIYGVPAPNSIYCCNTGLCSDNFYDCEAQTDTVYCVTQCTSPGFAQPYIVLHLEQLLQCLDVNGLLRQLSVAFNVPKILLRILWNTTSSTRIATLNAQCKLYVNTGETAPIVSCELGVVVMLLLVKLLSPQLDTTGNPKPYNPKP